MARGRAKPEISDDKFKAAIQMLADNIENPKKVTKKSIYEFLGVGSFATAEKMITEWQDEQTTRAEMRKKKRGTDIEGVELANIIEGYLSGDSFEDLANRHYRSTALIKATLERAGALLRENFTVDPLNPPDLPEEAMSYTFEVDEHVWIPAYQCMGVVKKDMGNDVYRVWTLSESTQQNIHVEAWNLGSMKHLEALGVDAQKLGYRWGREDTISLLNDAVRAALTRKRDSK
ncbi:MAG: hypothetical protein [Bacteriophage sp.]|nr:MAG: hypothetical protein [Bacteriophage sp.]